MKDLLLTLYVYMCTHTRTHAHTLTHTHSLTHRNEGMQAKVAEATVVIADASDAPTDAGGVVNKVPQTPTHVASLIDRRRSIIIA